MSIEQLVSNLDVSSFKDIADYTSTICKDYGIQFGVIMGSIIATNHLRNKYSPIRRLED